jgi:hypothetical protein
VRPLSEILALIDMSEPTMLKFVVQKLSLSKKLGKLKWRHLEARLDLSTFELQLLKWKSVNSAPTSPNGESEITESPTTKGIPTPCFASRNAANCIVTTKPIDSAHPYCLEFSFYPATQSPGKKASAMSSEGQSGTVTTWTLSLESKVKMDELINAVRQLQASKSKCMDRYAAYKAEAQAAIHSSWQRARGSEDHAAKGLSRMHNGSIRQLVGGKKASNLAPLHHSDTPTRSWQVCNFFHARNMQTAQFAPCLSIRRNPARTSQIPAQDGKLTTRSGTRYPVSTPFTTATSFRPSLLLLICHLSHAR